MSEFDDINGRGSFDEFKRHVAASAFPFGDDVDEKMKKGISIAERRAATRGFNASKINVGQFRNASPLSSPVVQSPYLTIPCGISPTALLDSPIMLPNSQLSPTTGTFPLPPLRHGNSVMDSANRVDVGGVDGGVGSSLMFEPHDGPFFWPCITELQNQPVESTDLPVELLKESATKTTASTSSAEVKVLANVIPNAFVEGSQKETYPITGIVKNSEDGYNWRKYGQKHVKGSEYPRSYYKCTHPNCLVKKKVERSLDGQITEIIYKGTHNHQIPHLSHLPVGSSASFSDMSEIGEGGDLLKNIQLGSKDLDWRPDGSERSSSTSILTDSSDLLSSAQGKSVGIFESAGTPEFPSTLGEDDDDYDDGGTNEGKLSPGDDADEDRSESKRRKKGNFLMESSMVSRAMREPRVVVQIESEIDILDDGYRWRKYGQKVVKGNPNPRSYYKCTSVGCLVRKHVERASDNPKAVITTYEGKHNHEVPASRNSKSPNIDVGNLPLTSLSNRHSNRELPRINGILKLEDAQVQDLPFKFERKPDTEFMIPSLAGSFGNGLKYGTSSMYQARFSPFENSMSLSSGSPILPDFPMSLPMSIPLSANTVHSGFGFRENNTRLVKPKSERDDMIFDFDPGPPIEDRANASLSSSMHCQFIPKFPP